MIAGGNGPDIVYSRIIYMSHNETHQTERHVMPKNTETVTETIFDLPAKKSGRVKTVSALLIGVAVVGLIVNDRLKRNQDEEDSDD